MTRRVRMIGIDFDNTIIRYDEVFAAAAVSRNLLPPAFTGTKTDVREALRSHPDGERAWQALQGHVYGAGIGDAVPFPGLGAFLHRARDEGVDVAIVSHKTEYGHFDIARVNLRAVAFDWLETKGFFDDGGLSRENVYFASTRDEKIECISALAPDVFIDDLPEVLDDPKFPAGVRPLLFTGDWSAIEGAVFDDRR